MSTDAAITASAPFLFPAGATVPLEHLLGGSWSTALAFWALPTALALSYPEFQKSWEEYLLKPAPGTPAATTR